MYGDNYEEIFEIGPDHPWLNKAYDEEDNEVYCPYCGSIINFDEDSNYECQSCETKFSRDDFFRLIEAEKVLSKCSYCTENFPTCAEDCEDWIEEFFED